jgi:hypothetical protein
MRLRSLLHPKSESGSQSRSKKVRIHSQSAEKKRDQQNARNTFARAAVADLGFFGPGGKSAAEVRATWPRSSD